MVNEREPSLNLFIALSRASQRVNAHADRDIRSYGLNRTEFGVLELLYHKVSQPIQQIGGKVLMSSGNITYVVDKLEQKHFVRRKASTDDRRRQKLRMKGSSLSRMYFRSMRRFGYSTGGRKAYG